jgi:hypothetical protein
MVVRKSRLAKKRCIYMLYDLFKYEFSTILPAFFA